jgi:Uma2 family endonuclease
MTEYTPAETLLTANETARPYGAKKKWTFEEYMTAEELSVEKHEFHNGKRTTMAGASKPHSIINMSIGAAIINALNSIEDDNTEVCSNDLKVFIPSINRAVYTDLTIVQGEAVMKHKHVITNPTLLVEVLSDSTETYDRGDKFDNYKTLPSFKEYVLVAQNEPLVDVYYRENPDVNEWQLTRFEGLNAQIELRSIGCILSMKDIYRRIFK